MGARSTTRATRSAGRPGARLPVRLPGTPGDRPQVAAWLAVALALLVALASAATATSRPAPRARSEPQPGTLAAGVVRRLPHDRHAFTQGLVFDRGVLYESTGQYGRSELRRVDLATGKVRQRHRLADRDFGEGLTMHGGRLVQLTWRSKAGYVYDPGSFRRVGRFGYRTEGWGITTDGRELIMSDGSAVLSYLDPVTFAVRRRVTVTAGGRPVERLNELEYVGGKVYANVWPTSRAVRVDPGTGRVDLWWDLAHLGAGLRGVANGIAYDATTGRMYVTGKNWPVMYEVRLPR